MRPKAVKKDDKCPRFVLYCYLIIKHSRLLSAFYDNHVNLVSIISRPTKKEMGTYNFYIETKGGFGEKDAVIKALNKINRNYGIKVMGIYSV